MAHSACPKRVQLLTTVQLFLAVLFRYNAGQIDHLQVGPLQIGYLDHNLPILDVVLDLLYMKYSTDPT